MTLKQSIQNEPYLRASNCTDLADVEHGLTEVRKLLEVYGSRPSLCAILARLEAKKEKLQAKETGSNLHPIFQQALKPFGIR